MSTTFIFVALSAPDRGHKSYQTHESWENNSLNVFTITKKIWFRLKIQVLLENQLKLIRGSPPPNSCWTSFASSIINVFLAATLERLRLCAKLQSKRVSMRAPFGDCFVNSRQSPWLTECSCEIRNQAYDVPSRSSLVSTASHFNRSESDDFRPVIFLQNFKNKRTRHMTTRRLRKHFFGRIFICASRVFLKSLASTFRAQKWARHESQMSSLLFRVWLLRSSTAIRCFLVADTSFPIDFPLGLRPVAKFLRTGRSNYDLSIF